MKKPPIIPVAALMVAGSLALALSQQPEVKRSDRATAR